MNESGETTGESTSNLLSLTINQLNITTMIKRILLHLIAFVALVPCVLMFNSSGEIWVNLLGFIYVCYLIILCNECETVRKFIRRYYHEILRIERGL